MRLTLILTKTPGESQTLEKFIELALSACSKGFTLAAYLVGNGVYCANKGEHVSSKLKRITEAGGEVFVRQEDLEARGLNHNDIISEAETPSDFYGQMVDDIMEKSDRVISF